VKFGGGSLMMWGCMTWQGVGYAAKIDGRMDGDLCLQILKDELHDSLRRVEAVIKAKVGYTKY
ncbi:hypothetical protein PAXRUDRAFT_836327, partial [Paxillus rubicundulus Ve08.2h10]